MRAVAHNAASPGHTPCAAAEAAFAEAKAFLCSAEAQQMSESDLERELHRRGQELMRKLLQGHLDQRRLRKAAGPVEAADDVECSPHLQERLGWVAFVDGAQTQLDLASAAVWQSTPSPQPSTWGRRRLCSIAPPASSKGVLVRGPRPNGVYRRRVAPGWGSS